jgi:MinD-like ATPase involved in chromosome partitioning or flagellar assembly
MNDQADSLRKMMEEAPWPYGHRAIVVLSGRPGSGKSTIVMQLAAYLESTGGKVLRLFNRSPKFVEIRDHETVFIELSEKYLHCLNKLQTKSTEVFIVLTPEASVIDETYELIKRVATQWGINRISIIVNQVTDAREALSVFKNLNGLVAPFMGFQLFYLGHLIKDKNVELAMLKRKNLVELYPGAAAVACLGFMAKRLKFIHSSLDERNDEDGVNSWV